MGTSEINQMKQALIRQGIQLFKLNGLNEEQLRKMCNEKLYLSLTGNKNRGKSDEFVKQYKYDQTYTLPSGENIMVAKVATSTLASGRKVETFVDIAGNQYFQYKASDNSLLKEDYFRKQEKMVLGQNFKFVDNKLYKTDLLGNLLTIIDDGAEKPAFTNLPGFKPKEETPKKFDYRNTIQKIQYHPVYKDLMLDKQGKIDMKQFSVDVLKRKYQGKDYVIEYTTDPNKVFFYGNQALIIKSKSGEVILDVQYSKEGDVFYNAKNRDKSHNYYTVNKDGVVTYGRHTLHDGSYVAYAYEADGKTVKQYQTSDKFGNCKDIEYKDNKINEVHTYQFKDGNLFNSEYIYYHNGKPVKKFKEGKAVNLLAQQIHNQLNQKDKLGYTIIDKNVISTINDMLDSDNIGELLNDYQNKYGVSLQESLLKGHGLDDNTRLKLLTQIDALNGEVSEQTLDKIRSMSVKDINIDEIMPYIDILDANEFGTAPLISKLLNASISQNNIKSFDKLLKKVNPINVVNIMQSYPQTKILSVEADKILPDSVNYLIYKYPKIAKIVCDNYSDLFSSLDEISLTKESKQKVIDFLIKNIQKSDYSPIGNDMAAHSTDKKKLKIDNMRILTNSAYIEEKPEEVDLKQFKGEFSTKILQEGANCWLVGSMISAAHKQKGNRKLQKLVSYDETNNTFTVNLKHFSKTYTIDEIVTRGGQLDGDYKARAVAMAFDDQFKEKAYNKNFFTIEYDNEGNYSSTFFEETLGNSHSISRDSLEAKDFNNPDRCYTLEYKVPNGMDWHVVAIVGADDNYVYYQDPGGKSNAFNEALEDYNTNDEVEDDADKCPAECGVEKMTWKQFRDVFGRCRYADLD